MDSPETEKVVQMALAQSFSDRYIESVEAEALAGEREAVSPTETGADRALRGTGGTVRPISLADAGRTRSGDVRNQRDGPVLAASTGAQFMDYMLRKTPILRGVAACIAISVYFALWYTELPTPTSSANYSLLIVNFFALIGLIVSAYYLVALAAEFMRRRGKQDPRDSG
jgi:hypothetical protein